MDWSSREIAMEISERKGRMASGSQPGGFWDNPVVKLGYYGGAAVLGAAGAAADASAAYVAGPTPWGAALGTKAAIGGANAVYNAGQAIGAVDELIYGKKGKK